MDNPFIKDWVLRVYETGWRAYRGINDGFVIFQNMETTAVNLCVNEDLEKWHALRAYQDEQRKKGEPIIMTDNQALQFSRLCLHSETQFNYVHAYTGQPGIQSITPLKPYGQRVNGRFTNFRWKPGYGPKRSLTTNDLRNDKPIGTVGITMQDLINRLENE